MCLGGEPKGNPNTHREHANLHTDSNPSPGLISGLIRICCFCLQATAFWKACSHCCLFRFSNRLAFFVSSHLVEYRVFTRKLGNENGGHRRRRRRSPVLIYCVGGQRKIVIFLLLFLSLFGFFFFQIWWQNSVVY